MALLIFDSGALRARRLPLDKDRSGPDQLLAEHSPKKGDAEACLVTWGARPSSPAEHPRSILRVGKRLVPKVKQIKQVAYGRHIAWHIGVIAILNRIGQVIAAARA